MIGVVVVDGDGGLFCRVADRCVYGVGRVAACFNDPLLLLRVIVSAGLARWLVSESPGSEVVLSDLDSCGELERVRLGVWPT